MPSLQSQINFFSITLCPCLSMCTHTNKPAHTTCTHNFAHLFAEGSPSWKTKITITRSQETNLRFSFRQRSEAVAQLHACVYGDRPGGSCHRWGMWGLDPEMKTRQQTCLCSWLQFKCGHFRTMYKMPQWLIGSKTQLLKMLLILQELLVMSCSWYFHFCFCNQTAGQLDLCQPGSRQWMVNFQASGSQFYSCFLSS